jgi:hypothetical protein
MPQTVLQHGRFFCEEGDEYWRLRPSPGGHEKGVHEVAAVVDLDLQDACGVCVETFGMVEDDSEDSVALPWERRRPAGRRAKGGETDE